VENYISGGNLKSSKENGDDMEEMIEINLDNEESLMDESK
jgi:hypothetical protein